MSSNKKLVITAILTILVLSFIWLTTAAPCRAQATPPLPDRYQLETNGVNSTDVPSVVTDQPLAADRAAPAPGQAGNTAPDEIWHLSVSPISGFPECMARWARAGVTSGCMRARVIFFPISVLD
jgi:hypothetical protein